MHTPDPTPAADPRGPDPRSPEPCSAPGAYAAAAANVRAHHAKGERRPPDTIWRPNPREQGLIGLTDAVAWFAAQGWDICLPLIDSQPYDLVVDDGATLSRVQVKTTTQRTPRGRFVVTLCTGGGNQSFHTKKRFDPTSCDLLFVLTDDQERYLIPTDAIEAGAALSLGAKVARFRVAGAEPPV